MKTKLWLAVVMAFGLATQAARAQAPAGATGQCKDGTYTTAKAKSGACGHHGGVQTWTTAGTGTSPTAANTSTPAPTPVPARTTPAPAPMQPAPRAPMPSQAAAPQPAPQSSMSTGGAGQVWVNLPTKVYHCAGTQWYGKTKNGKYMSESEAMAMGARADHNKPCSR